jgi:RNA polymerase sigma factor (sigma-70 family)
MEFTHENGGVRASDPSDEDLVAAVQQQGNREAVAQLVERYAARLRGCIRSLALRAGLREHELEDALQEALVTLLEVIARYDPQRSFSDEGPCFHAYVARSLRNRFHNVCRSRRRGQRCVSLFSDVAFLETDDLGVSTAIAAPSDDDPAALAESRERVVGLWAALERLSAEDHDLLADVVEKVPWQQIAQRCGVSLATVKRSWERLRARLRAELDRLAA